MMIITVCVKIGSAQIIKHSWNSELTIKKHWYNSISTQLHFYYITSLCDFKILSIPNLAHFQFSNFHSKYLFQQLFSQIHIYNLPIFTWKQMWPYALLILKIWTVSLLCNCISRYMRVFGLVMSWLGYRFTLRKEMTQPRKFSFSSRVEKIHKMCKGIKKKKEGNEDQGGKSSSLEKATIQSWTLKEIGKVKIYFFL